jgi:phosphoesterase RecJ-like protein
MSAYFPHESATFRELLANLRGKRTAILGHLRPDGDCIGSQVALCRVLRDAGADAVCVNGHTVPRNLRFLVRDTPFSLGADFAVDGREAVFVDCSDPGRAGNTLVGKFAVHAANIDHHVSNTRFAGVNIVLPEAAAACAMLAAFLFDTGTAFDAATAQALYTGIVTDTGQFKYPATTPEILEIAARLLRAGASIPATTSALYEESPFAGLALLQRFLATLELRDGGRVCVGEIPAGTYEATGTTSEDADGLVDYARCVAGVDIAVLLEDAPNGVKGSLRAKDPRYRGDLLAAKLGGGGHVLAAGFFQPGATLANDRQRILGIVSAHLAEADAGALPALATTA